MHHRAAVMVLLLLLAAGCSKGREYELQGQVLAVNPDRQELTIKHEDIRGFMPAMTMPFKVRRRALLDGRVPGDLVKATLVVKDSDAYLSAVEATGRAPLTDVPPATPLRILDTGAPVGDVDLVDQSSRALKLSDWRGQVIAVTFIYTRCPLPNFCPLMDRQFADVQRALKGDARMRGRARLISVSFDPAFDTAAVLADHAVRAGADPAIWSFATGERAAIDAFASQFGVSVMRDDPQEREILHNLRTAVIDPSGRLAAVLNGNEWTAAELLEAMRRAGA